MVDIMSRREKKEDLCGRRCRNAHKYKDGATGTEPKKGEKTENC